MKTFASHDWLEGRKPDIWHNSECFSLHAASTLSI